MGLLNGSFLRRRGTEANASRRDIQRNAEKKVYDEIAGHKEVSAPSTEPGPGVWKIFVDIIAVIGALVAIIIPAVNWDKLKTPFACAAVIIGAILFALAVARLARRRKARKLDLDAILDIAVVGGFCICVTGVIISIFGSTSTGVPSNSTKPIASSSHAEHPAIKILAPESQAPGDPPIVGCVQPITVNGKLSPEDTLIVGNAKSGSDDYFFIPVKQVAEQPENWTGTAYFGNKSDGGSSFHLVVVVIPQTLEAYMRSIYDFQRETEGAYLAGPGLPPAPAYVARRETVLRSTSNSGCKK